MDQPQRTSPCQRSPRLAALALIATSLWLGGCSLEGADCSTERCEVWICGAARPACPCSDLCERPQCGDVAVYVRDPETDECFAVANRCEVPDGWEYFADDETCRIGLTMCRVHDDCAPDEVCDIPSCVNDDAGACIARPEACPEAVEPVWGCDGVQYDNDCLRLRAGARLDASEVVTGCVDEGPVWAQDPRSGACSYFGGTCFVPDGWPVFFSRAECEGPGCSPDPVWFFDPDQGQCIEVTSDCEVPLGLEFFGSRAQCEGASHRCGPGSGCLDGTVCDLFGCGTATGTCVALPDDCIVIQSETPLGEVCGCDGVTYPGDCERLRAGVGLAYRGGC